MKNLVLTIFIITSHNIFGQDLIWKNPISAGSECHAIAMDSIGDFYFAGTVSNEVKNQTYFNTDTLPRLYNYNSYCYLVKTDKFFNPKWTKIIPAFAVHNISVDKNDQVVLIGLCGKYLMIDSFNLVIPEIGRAVIVKFDQSGKLLWTNTIKGSWVYFSDLKIDIDNDIYVSGNFSGDMTFFTNTVEDTTVGYGRLWFYYAKFDNNGSFKWVKIDEGENTICINAMAVDSNKNIYLTGSWVEGQKFENQSKISSSPDIFIAKYNSNQQFQWLKQIGTPTDYLMAESGNDLALDEKSGYLYVTGSFLANADFGGTKIDANDKNIFLACYNLEGNLIWVKNMGCWSGAASYREQGEHLFTDKDGFVYITGQLEGAGDFEGTSISSYQDPNISNIFNDPFIAKFNSSGKLIYVTHFGSTFDDDLNDLIKDNDDNIIFAGQAQPNSKFGDKAFLSNDCGYIGEFNDSSENATQINNVSHTVDFELFPNPAHDNLYLQFSNENYYNSEVSIADLTGRVILRIHSANNMINISDLSIGVYFINIRNKEINVTQKFIKR